MRKKIHRLKKVRISRKDLTEYQIGRGPSKKIREAAWEPTPLKTTWENGVMKGTLKTPNLYIQK